jgi:hypothetical protein
MHVILEVDKRGDQGFRVGKQAVDFLRCWFNAMIKKHLNLLFGIQSEA